MADRILFLGWNRSVTGREQQALKLFEKGMEFFGKLQADDKIENLVGGSRIGYPLPTERLVPAR